jgi:iron complex transport system substrate-binding protein
MAAGAPAEVLLYTLSPEMLVGRNRVPEGRALEFFPPAFRSPTPIRQLPEVDNPETDTDLLRLKPDVYVDYGTIDPDYVAAVEAVQRRTKVPGLILDGALARIPEAYRRLGSAFGIAARGEQLAAGADRILTKYRGALASSAARVYLACSTDGYSPCFADERAGEQLQWLGGVNAAGTRASAPRRPLTIDEIRALKPDLIVLNGGAGTVARLRADSAWASLDAVKTGRVYSWPALPFGWGSRPPSVNRLPGLIWLAHVAASRPFDATFSDEIRRLFKVFYHLDLTEAQLRTLLSD